MSRICILVLSLFASFGYGQKKKPVAKAPVATNTVVAKADNISAEIAKGNFYLFINTNGKKDTVLIKTIDPKKMPAAGKITPFKAKGAQLYALSWTETANTETKLKKESSLTTFTEIYDLPSKTKVLANAQITTTISEIVFLDKNQTVSETQQKLRREGFEFILLPDGDVILKNKAQENKMTYSATEKKYVNAPVKKK
jgi:hypothetical protein